MIKRITAAAALSALMLLVCMTCALAEGENRLLVYMVGSDLESASGYASMDLQEMMNAFPDDGKLEVLICAGGATRWQRLISPETPAVYRLTGSGLEMLASCPDGSMMDGETLSWFLEQADADVKTALLFWNHGGGPLVGFGYDETDPGDRLQAWEIVQALQSDAANREKFAWIGFDACLMGTLEMAGLLEPYADYLIASEEVEMGCGWDYSFLARMTEGLSVPRLANCILSDFFDTTVAACGGDPLMMPAITLACYDLSRYPRLADRFDELARQMDASVAFGSFAALAHSRSSVPAMGRFSGGLNTELVDLRRLVQSVQAYYPEEVQAVMDALDEMVVACVSNNPDNSGISVYFPYSDKAEYLSGMDEIYRGLMPVKGYRAFVDRFAQQWVAGTLEQTQLLQSADGEKPSILLSDELLGSYADAYYVIAQDFGSNGYGLYYMGSETELSGNVLTADYPMETAYLVSGEERFPIFLRKQEEDQRRILYHASAFVVKMPEDPALWDIADVEIQIAMNKQTRQCTVVGAYLEEEQMQLGKRQVDLSDWDFLQTVFVGYEPTRNLQGALLPYAQWYPTGSAFGIEIALDEAFGIEMMPIGAMKGDLYCQFVIEDVYGNLHGSELVLLQEGSVEETQRTEQQSRRLFWENMDAPLTLADTEYLRLELTDVNRSTGAFFTLQASNKTEQDLYLSLEHLALNGVMIDAPGMVQLQPKENFQWIVDVSSYPFECVTTDMFTSMQLYLTMRDDTFAALAEPLYLEAGLEWPILMSRSLYDRAAIRMRPAVLWDDEEVSIAATDVAVSRTDAGTAEVYFALQNQTDGLIRFETGDGYLNEWMLEKSSAAAVLLPGTRAFAAVEIGGEEFEPAADGSDRLGLIWNWQEPSAYAPWTRSTGLQEIAVEVDKPAAYVAKCEPSPWATISDMAFRKRIGSGTVECALTLHNLSDRHIVLSASEIVINGQPCRCTIRAVMLPGKSTRVSSAVNAAAEAVQAKGAVMTCTLDVYDVQQQVHLGQIQLNCTVE